MSNTAGQETIDLRAILRKLLAVWWLFLITLVLCVGAGVGENVAWLVCTVRTAKSNRRVQGAREAGTLIEAVAKKS